MRLYTLLLALSVWLGAGCAADYDPADVDGDGYTLLDGDCAEGDASAYPGGPETWYDGIDGDCDGANDYDADGDGFDGGEGGEDCDDADPSINPGATELCDGVDNDCDGAIDGSGLDGAQVWYADEDGDGYGDADVTIEDCDAPDGYVPDDSDCDDADPGVNPYEDELCDGVDQDCDGDVDESPIDGEVFYADADADGYGGDDALEACEAPSGYVDVDGDCDDADPAYNPGADESDCSDPNDYNCDGSTGYDDLDGDGYAACEECDDGDGDVNPGAFEDCATEADDDCNGETNEVNAANCVDFYFDADGDGYGAGTATVCYCEAVEGTSATADDCDDGEITTYPGADEYCDGEDDDCDSQTDEDGAVDVITWYADDDSDGYRDEDVTDLDCYQPSGYLPESADTDCDDSREDVNPAADEYCDGAADEDCDGDVDEDGAADAFTWYADTDGDSYGEAGATDVDCYQPSGYVLDSTDCDDGRSDVNPGADEYCDGATDEDCDDAVDEDGAADVATWYADDDSDGYGDASSADVDCDQPDGYVADDSDCDDGDGDSYPGADEYCDGEDDDCDGATDEDGAVDVATWYADDDSDGYGDASSADVDCDQPSGYVADATDCDDGDSDSYPGADEYCDGANDEDCDGDVDEDGAVDASTWYADADSDGYGDAATTDAACDVPTGYTSDDSDCDDDRGDVNPGADEYCDGATDEDCDDAVDEDGAVDTLDWYADSDGDGFGDPSDVEAACEEPSDHVDNDDDCDDGDGAINPDADEICNGDDDDCDGDVDDDDDDVSDAPTWYADGDSDDYGDPSDVEAACEAPSGYVDNDDDCDPTRGDVNPGADEYCDGATDEDCDSAIDEDGAVDAIDWYADSDEDGYGDAAATAAGCDQPSGYTDDDGDCDDARDDVNPGIGEVCDDGADNDCDDTTDEAAAETDDLYDNDCDEYVDEDFVSAGDIIISELMIDPNGSDASGEWFELHNTSSRDIRLDGWEIDSTDYKSTETYFWISPDPEVIVPAGGYIIFCRAEVSSSSTYGTAGLDCAYFYGEDTGYTETSFGKAYSSMLFNNNDADELYLYLDDTLIDGFSYDASFPPTNKYSIELSDNHLDATSNDDATNWCDALSSDAYNANNYGTPGEANSCAL